MTRFGTFLLLWLFSVDALAALIDRGGGLIYDNVQNITWLQDANYTQSSGYDANGRISWPEAVVWADTLSYYDPIRQVWYDDWRLPSSFEGDPSCDLTVFTPDPADVLPTGGYGFGCIGSELGHLFYVDGISYTSPGPFLNLENDIYWSGTPYSPKPAVYAWYFDLRNGYQYIADAGSYGIVSWAVRDGDVSGQVVPIPAAGWLFASALGGIAWLRRRVS